MSIFLGAGVVLLSAEERHETGHSHLAGHCMVCYRSDRLCVLTLVLLDHHCLLDIVLAERHSYQARDFHYLYRCCTETVDSRSLVAHTHRCSHRRHNRSHRPVGTDCIGPDSHIGYMMPAGCTLELEAQQLGHCMVSKAPGTDFDRMPCRRLKESIWTFVRAPVGGTCPG